MPPVCGAVINILKSVEMSVLKSKRKQSKLEVYNHIERKDYSSCAKGCHCTSEKEDEETGEICCG